MHCANLDALVKDGTSSLQQSPQQTTLPTAKSLMETKEEEDSRMLSMVLDIGILVLEGRLPDRTSKRGYTEGPHCVLYPRTQAHRCDCSSYMCKRAEKYRQLMQTIWNERKGLCIELRVCADCSCGEEQAWTNAISRFDYVLEQWYFEITNVRNDDEDIGVMNWYGLLQAIRSQIHFSQLSAWWSSNRAPLPKNITYHVLPLSQANAESCALQHKFPVLAFSTTYLQVKVRSQPRSEVLPKIHCPVHCDQDDVVDDRMKIHCDRLGKHHCQALEDLDENENERWYTDGEFCDGILVSAQSDGGVPREIRDVGPGHPVRKTKTWGREGGTDGLLKLRRSECCRTDSRFSTFQRSSGDVPSRVFVSSSKNTLNSTSSAHAAQPAALDAGHSGARTNLFPPVGGYISASSLTEGTTTQLFNICNWTNTMVSNVMSRVRNGTTLMSNLSEPSLLADLFKLSEERVKSSESSASNCRTCMGNTNVSVRSTDAVKVDIDRINEFKARNSKQLDNSDLQLITSITATGAGDRCSKISPKHRRKNFNLLDNNSINGMGAYSDEKKHLKVPGKSITSTLKDRKSELLNGVAEKGFRFEKSRKRLLPFVGNVVESVLSGRVYFARIVQNFKMKITTGVSFSGQNGGSELQAASYYYHFGDGDLSMSYLVKSLIPDQEKGVQIPSSGQLQVSVFNTEDSLIKVFIVPYDLSDMPRCTKTYIRHSNYYTPTDATEHSVKWLQSLLQLKCLCSKSGRLYLQNEVNAIIFQKSDLNTACELQQKIDLKYHDVTKVAYK